LRKSNVIAAVMMCAFMAGCGPVVKKPGQVRALHTEVTDATAMPYQIGVGDELEVKFFFTPELNDRITVRPDGKISIMFAQDIKASGESPEQLAKMIKKKLAPHVTQPDLVVVVRSFGSQKVFVGGEVSKPGPVSMAGRERILHVLAEAGWMTPAAKSDEVILVRKLPDGHENVYPLNLKKAISGEDMLQNVMLQPGDLVMVPPSDVVVADRWVDQHLRQMLFFNTSAGVTASMTGGTIQ
jgi:polysaccharide biosynthesis/export protein